MSMENSQLKQKMQRFAEKYIAGYPQLDSLTNIPADIRQQMIAQKLYGVAVDTQFNGYGNPFSCLLNAAKSLVEYGGNMGLAMSWLVHEIVSSWLIMSHATDLQKKDYLPLFAAGRKTVCFAVSEPRAGAHPKYLKTVAEKAAGGYRLNGEKTYLTNGPMADVFIVIAITGNFSGKKQFSAFIIPKESKGLTITEPIDLPFLRPCPHGGIRLTDCKVKSEQIIGRTGDAYTEMVLPLRTVEDTLMTGLVSGGLHFLVNRLVQFIKQENINLEDGPLEEFAAIKFTLDALEAVSMACAGILEQNLSDKRLMSMGLFFRMQAIETLKGINQLIEKTGIASDQKVTSVFNDLSAIVRIGENTSKINIQKLGRSLFEPEDAAR